MVIFFDRVCYLYSAFILHFTISFSLCKNTTDSFKRLNNFQKLKKEGKLLDLQLVSGIESGSVSYGIHSEVLSSLKLPQSLTQVNLKIIYFIFYPFY